MSDKVSGNLQAENNALKAELQQLKKQVGRLETTIKGLKQIIGQVQVYCYSESRVADRRLGEPLGMRDYGYQKATVGHLHHIHTVILGKSFPNRLTNFERKKIKARRNRMFKTFRRMQ